MTRAIARLSQAGIYLQVEVHSRRCPSLRSALDDTHRGRGLTTLLTSPPRMNYGGNYRTLNAAAITQRKMVNDRGAYLSLFIIPWHSAPRPPRSSTCKRRDSLQRVDRQACS